MSYSEDASVLEMLGPPGTVIERKLGEDQKEERRRAWLAVMASLRNQTRGSLGFSLSFLFHYFIL